MENPERGQPSRVSRAIKQPVERLSYFSYLFREYRRVREFGRRTHVLEAHVIPPVVRMEPRIPALLADRLPAWARELSGWLARVTEHGWLYLTPRQYNTIALLKKFSDRIQAFDFSKLNLRDPRLIDRMRRIESLFLMLSYDPQTVAAIHTAVRTFCEQQHEDEAQVERVDFLVQQILSPDASLPSLSNVLVGLNIARGRKLLSLADLMREGLGEIVNARGFDCPPEVRTRMDGYIDEALGSLSRLHGQIQEARRISSYVIFDDDGKPDPAVLWKVYETGAGRDVYDFDADQGNLVLFAARLLRGFERIYSPVLNGQCQLAEAGRTAIFSRSFFELEISRLRLLCEKLEKGPFHFSSFPLSRYLAIKAEKIQTIGHEMEVSQVLDEAVACMVDLGKTITKVLSLRSALPPAGSGSSASSAPAGALEPSALKGKSFVLPHESHHIQGASFLSGMTVFEALSSAVTACFTTGMLFHDDFLSLFLGREKSLGTDLRQRMKLIENLLDPEKFRELSSLYA